MPKTITELVPKRTRVCVCVFYQFLNTTKAFGPKINMSKIVLFLINEMQQKLCFKNKKWSGWKRCNVV